MNFKIYFDYIDTGKKRERWGGRCQSTPQVWLILLLGIEPGALRVSDIKFFCISIMLSPQPQVNVFQASSWHVSIFIAQILFWNYFYTVFYYKNKSHQSFKK